VARMGGQAQDRRAWRDLRRARCALLSVTTVLVVFAFSASSAFASAPAPPTNASATATSGQAVVSFTAPTVTGGLPIISYSVTASPGGAHASGTASPITVTGLTDGTSYTFTVTATNANAGTNTIYFQGRLSASGNSRPGSIRQRSPPRPPGPLSPPEPHRSRSGHCGSRSPSSRRTWQPRSDLQ
jgi:Fibronectin type III domain